MSAKTVYDAFTTKPGLLRAVWDLKLKGDTDDTPMAARPWFLDVLDEPDPHKALVLTARYSTAVKERIGDLLRVIRSAASVDVDSAALWALIQTEFHANQGIIVAALAKRGGLRRGLSIEKAADILWTLNHPDTWLLLHHERGWTTAEFAKWFVDSAAHALLRK